MLSNKMLMMHNQNSSTKIDVKQVLGSISKVIHNGIHLNSKVRSPTL
jgi:hypothetical protein